MAGPPKRDAAVVSVFRHASEVLLFRIYFFGLFFVSHIYNISIGIINFYVCRT